MTDFLYYLIPFETDEHGQITSGLQPKFLSFFPAGAKGVTAKRLSYNAFLRNYYIVRTPMDSGTSWIEGNSDIIPLTRDYASANSDFFSELGIDTSFLTPETPDSELEKRLVIWLTGKETTIKGLFNGLG